MKIAGFEDPALEVLTKNAQFHFGSAVEFP